MRKLLSCGLVLALCGSLLTPAFAADEGMTRGELAQQLVQLCGYTQELETYEAQPSIYTDVADDAAYQGAANLLHDKGLMQGSGGGAFQPQRTATPLEAATALMRWMGLSDGQIGAWPNDYSALADSLVLTAGDVLTACLLYTSGAPRWSPERCR